MSDQPKRYEPDFNEDGPTMIEARNGRWVSIVDYQELLKAYQKLDDDYDNIRYSNEEYKSWKD